jgi:ABC-type polysaccharide/polyol phosphate transport system ATPase subunit
VASHDPLLIDRVCNRVLRLEHGIIAEDIVKRKAAGVQDPTQALEESL